MNLSDTQIQPVRRYSKPFTCAACGFVNDCGNLKRVLPAPSVLESVNQNNLKPEFGDHIFRNQDRGTAEKDRFLW